MMAKWDRSIGRPEPIDALNRIDERENGEPLVDIRIVAPSVYIHRKAVIPFLRKPVAEMAERAAKSLPNGWKLGCVDAWRPFERQKRIYDWLMQCAIEAFPSRTHAQLRRTVNRWAAPYDQKAPPGHCTGAAIDVWLLDESGEPIDVSSPFDRFSAGPTHSLGLTDEAKRNRMILYEAMTGAGFSNCRDEWWHYSFGDAGWAVREGLSTCFYGIANLEGIDFEEEEVLSAEHLAKRNNPFLTGK